MKRAVRVLRRAMGEERGSAVLEVTFLGVLLFVPLVYLVVTLSRVQAGAYAASAAARESARLFVTAPDGGTADARAHAGARVALRNFGLDGRVARIACSADPCLSPEATVTVRAEVIVELPLVPDLLDDVVPTTITVSATHVEQVDRFREVRP